MKRLLVWLSDLRVAIVLLLLIALASAVGTAIPQGDPPTSYVEAYANTPWLGLLHGEQVLQLQLDHVLAVEQSQPGGVRIGLHIAGRGITLGNGRAHGTAQGNQQ